MNSEKRGEKAVSKSILESFNNMINKSNLFEVPTMGKNRFTWSNEQGKDKRITCQLDRGLVNEEWLNTFPHVYLRYEEEVISDHCLYVYLHGA